MAEKLSVELDVNASEAEKSLAKFGHTIKDIKESEFEPLTFAISELEDRLYEMAIAGKKGSKEFTEMAAEIARMKTAVLDADMAVDAMTGTMTSTVIGAAGGVASGFELMQGAIGAFGAESEKVEEALLKVNSAMAMAQGLQGIKESIPAVKALWVALAANPLGLILTAITAIVAAFTYFATQVKTNFAKAFDNVTKSLDNYIKNLGKANEAQNKMLDKTLKGLDKEAARRIALGEDAVKVQKEINEAKIKELEISIEQDKMAVKSLRLQKNRLLQSKEEVALQYEKLILAQQEEVTFYRKAGLNEIALTYEIKMGKLAQEKLEMEKKIQTAIDKTSETITQRKEDIESNTDAVEDLKTSIIAMETESRRQAQETANERNALKKELDDYAKQIGDVGLKLKEAKAIDHQDSIEKSQERWLAEKEALDNIASYQKQKAQESIQLRKDTEQAKVDAVKSGLDLIVEMTELFNDGDERRAKAAFRIKKAASLAQASISAIEGTQNAFKTAADSPITTLFPAYPFIQAGLAAGFGAVKIAAIAKQQFGGGGSVGSSSGGGGSSTPSLPASSPANFTIVGNSGTNQLAETLTNAPIQAYVVGGEVTSQQQLDRNKVKVASW